MLKLFLFFLSSLAAVSIDLAVFQGIVYFNRPVFFANILSSSVAIITNYFLLTYCFRLKTEVMTFIAFFVYYASSITFFSFGIACFTEWGDWPPIIYKLLSLPISFGVNYLFTRKILRTVS